MVIDVSTDKQTARLLWACANNLPGNTELPKTETSKMIKGDGCLGDLALGSIKTAFRTRI